MIRPPRPNRNLTINMQSVLSGSTNSGKNQSARDIASYLSALTASQYAEMFPDYFRRGRPDIGISASGVIPGRQLPSAGIPGVGRPATAAARAARQAQTSGNQPGTGTSPGTSPGTARGTAPVWQGGTPEVNRTDELPKRSPGVSGALQEQRQRFFEALDKNPNLKRKFLAIAANEQGIHPEGTQAVMESLINRAIIRGGSIEGGLARLEKEIRFTSEGGYYEDAAGQSRAWTTVNDPKSRKILEDSYERTRAGGNVSNYGYGNASAGTAKNKITGAEGIRANPTKEINGETFFEPNSDERAYIKNYPIWKKKLIDKAAENAAEGGDVLPNLALLNPEMLKDQKEKEKKKEEKAAIGFGDSVMNQILGHNKSIQRGFARDGAPPKEIFEQIKAYDREALKGKKVYLSTGILNNTNDTATVRSMVDYVKESGGEVVIIGGPNKDEARDDLKGVHKELSKIADETGSVITNPYTPSKDKVHMKDMNELFPPERQQTGPSSEVSPVKSDALKIVDRTKEMAGYGSRGRQAPYEYIGVHFTADESLESAVSWAKQSNVGYQYLIDKDGTVHMVQNPDEGRSNHWGPANNHPRAKNANSIAISFVGKNETATKEQIEAGIRLIEQQTRLRGIPPENVLGHGEVTVDHRSATEGYAILKRYRQIHGLIPGGDKKPDISSPDGWKAWERANYSYDAPIEKQEAPKELAHRAITFGRIPPGLEQKENKLMFNTSRAYTENEVQSMIKEHGKNLIIGANMDSPEEYEKVRLLAEKYGLKMHGYSKGRGAPQSSWGNQFPNEQKEIQALAKERGISLNQWYNGGWMDYEIDRLRALGKNAPSQIELDNFNDARTSADFEKELKKYADSGLSTRIVPKNWGEKEYAAYNRLVKEKQIRNDLVIPLNLVETKYVKNNEKITAAAGHAYGNLPDANVDEYKTSTPITQPAVEQVKQNNSGGKMQVYNSKESTFLVNEGGVIGSVAPGESISYNKSGQVQVIPGHRTDPNAIIDKSGKLAEAARHASAISQDEYNIERPASMTPTEKYQPQYQIGNQNINPNAHISPTFERHMARSDSISGDHYGTYGMTNRTTLV